MISRFVAVATLVCGVTSAPAIAQGSPSHGPDSTVTEAGDRAVPPLGEPLFGGRDGPRALVPHAAIAVANESLPEWKRRAKINPNFFGLTSALDVNIARLDSPFVEHVIRDEDIRAFVESPSIDPTDHTTYSMYLFPVLIGDEPAGCLVVVENRELSGEPIMPGKNDYILVAITPRGNQINETLLLTRKAYPSARGYETSLVRFMRGSTVPYVVTRDSAGRLFTAGQDGLVPIEQALGGIKRALRESLDKR